jgi:glycerol-3-phosphate dehydrogenase (NAD(P)+)
MFPVWLGLRGGKGVATAFGVFLVLVPYAALGSLAVFVIVFCARALRIAGLDPGSGGLPTLCLARSAVDAIIRHHGHHRHRVRLDFGEASAEHPAPVGGDGVPLRLRQEGPSCGSRRGAGTCMSRITVLGSGAWGTAIALSLAKKGNHKVTLWSHRAEAAEALDRSRENLRFLPGFPFPDSLHVTANDALAIAEAEILICVVPSEFLRPTIGRLTPHLHPGQILVSATKGLEDHSFLRMTEVIQSCVSKAGLTLPVGALSGPSFAQEVAAGMPTALTIAFSDPAVASTHPAGVLKLHAAPLHQRRRHRRGDGRGAQERHRHRRRSARRPGPRPNSAAGLITRGIAEIDPPSRCRRRAARDPERSQRHRRSGADLHRLALPQPHRWLRARPRAQAAEILASLDGKVAEGVRTTRAAWAGPQAGRRNAHHRADGADSRRRQRSEEAIRDLMLRPNRDED